MKLNHIGYVVSNLKQSADIFEASFDYKIDSNEIVEKGE